MRDDSPVEIFGDVCRGFVIANDPTIKVFADFISIRLGFDVAKNPKVRVFDDLFCHMIPLYHSCSRMVPFWASSKVYSKPRELGNLGIL